MAKPDPSQAFDDGPIAVSAPGKIILFGEHAVVYGKAAIACSVGLRTRILLKCSSTNSESTILYLRFHNLDDFQYGWPLEKLIGFEGVSQRTEVDSYIRAKIEDEFLKGVCQDDSPVWNACLAFWYVFLVLYEKSGRRDKSTSLRFEVDSLLFVGAGLGSSASYSVCVATCLLMHFGYIQKNIVEKEGYRSSDLSTQYASLINEFAFLAEKLIHGNPSGIDNTVCTYGGAICFKKGQEFVRLCRMQELWLYLTDTKVPRQTRELVSGVRQYHQYIPEVLDGIFSAIDAISRKFIDLQETELLSEGYYRLLETLIDMNECLLEALGVGHDKIRLVCDHFRTSAGLHSKLTGAGGGGCVITLLNPFKGIVDGQPVSLPGMNTSKISVGGEGVAYHPIPAEVGLTLHNFPNLASIFMAPYGYQ